MIPVAVDDIAVPPQPGDDQPETQYKDKKEAIEAFKELLRDKVNIRRFKSSNIIVVQTNFCFSASTLI